MIFGQMLDVHHIVHGVCVRQPESVRRWRDYFRYLEGTNFSLDELVSFALRPRSVG